MRRRRVLTMVAVLGALAILIPVVIAQTRRQPASLQAAVRAVLEGRYDEVPALTAALDVQDPAVAAIRARALVARGHYRDAESMLTPLAKRLPSSDAALELGLLLDMLGRAEARAVLQRVAAVADTATDAHGLARGARALRALREYQDANVVYRAAVKLVPADPAIQTAWGDLFLDRYQRADALKSYEAALQADPAWQPALFGSALALADENPPQAIEIAKKALAGNPSDVAVLVFLAEQAMDGGDRGEARKLLAKALEVNPSSLEARAILAGLAYVEDRTADFDAEVAKVLAIAPAHGEVFRVAGDLAASNYRFDEAAALVRRALDLRPNDAQSLADLGVHLLRTGDEPGARRALDASWNLDKFNVVTLNLLRMMDTLDTFVTITDGDLVVRMDKEEAPVLGPYVLATAHQALASLSKRYQFTVQGPILIEIFPKHDDFAVRNVGLPGMIGALGACFGRVVTMDSPRARPPGESQWEAVLWHELAHVVTLQMSQQRIPRWLTEGISEYEEKIAKPEWARGMDVAFAQMLNAGETLKLEDLNAAFTNPKTISLAYFQGALFVEHLATLHGEAGLQKLVRVFATGVDTETALKQTLGTDFGRLQASFDQAMEKKYGALRQVVALPEPGVDLRKMPPDALQQFAARNPRSYPAQFMLGNALRRAGEVGPAMEAFERAATLVPNVGGEESPRAQMAQMAMERKDTTRAIAELRALMSVDFDNVEAARQLAALLRESKVTDPAILYPVYARIVAIDPFDAEAHRMVGTLAVQRREYELAAREFTAVLALKPVDQAGAHTDLADAYFRAGKRAQARTHTLAALEIAPGYERAQTLLLQIAAR